MKKLNNVAVVIASVALLGGCSVMTPTGAPAGTRVAAANGGTVIEAGLDEVSVIRN